MQDANLAEVMTKNPSALSIELLSGWGHCIVHYICSGFAHQ